MKILRKKTENNKIIMDIVASAGDVEKAFEAAHLDFAQRMGLMPDGSKSIAQLAEERFGLKDLDATVAPQVVECLVPFAVDLLDFAPAYPANCLNSAQAKRGQELIFTCEVALKGDLTLSTYGPVTIHIPPFALAEEQVDKQIAEMADAHAEFKEIEPRPARMGDSCLLNILAQEDHVDIPEFCTEKAIYNLGSHLIGGGFDEQVVGMSAGESKSFALKVVIPSDGHHLRLIDFDLHLLEVRAREVPTIDDAWIRDNAPGVDSLESFKDLLRSEFTKSYKDEYEDMKRQQAMGELARRFTGTVADEAILAMQKTIVNNMESKLEQEGSSLEKYIEENGGEQQFNILTMMQSKEALMQGYALDSLFLHEKMQLNDEDIRIACKAFDADNPDMIRKQMEYSGCGYMLREAAERLKASTWIVEHAEIIIEDSEGIPQPSP